MVPVIWSVWALCVVFLAVMYLYRSRLTRDEDDQIFLDDSFSHERTAQAAITAKVQKIEPVLRASIWLVGPPKLSANARPSARRGARMASS